LHSFNQVLMHVSVKTATQAVDAVDGVLWSIGPKDIARFDGQMWERIHNDDNLRIEEPKSDGWEG
jgi:hypothetical protein